MQIESIGLSSFSWTSPDSRKVEKKPTTVLYRMAIYGLLAVLIAFGFVLSWAMAKNAKEVRAAAVPSLKSEVNVLEQISQFENSLLSHQLAVNEYLTGTISRERFLGLEQLTLQEMGAHLHALEQRDGFTSDIEALDESYQNLKDLTQSLEENVSLSAGGLPDKSQVLQQLIRKGNDAGLELNRVKSDAEAMLYATDNAANTSVFRIATLLHIYNVLIVCVGLFMIYHIRARIRSEDDLAFQAAHDPLTGLAHRRSFETRLCGLTKSPHTIVLGMIDRFERIIGGVGHAGSDRIMQQIACRLQQIATRNGGEVYRLDGANFAILYTFSKNEPVLQEVLSELRSAMHRSFEFDRHEIFLSLSLGAAEYPRHGRDPKKLLRNADAALKAAHEMGGDCVVTYSDSLDTRANECLLMEAALSHAIERGELELYYQPQQHLASNALMGFEALVRWHWEGRMVSPAEFIPLAEESGLIIPIGDWILTEACRQAKLWRDQTGRDLLVAVNISPRQFRHPDFLKKVTKTLADTGVKPSNIELEITEGMVMEGAEKMINLLRELRNLGVKLAIDDFGTGYSSLSYLTRFPVNRLKIDQSFIRHLERGAGDVGVVQAAIQLGHHLGMEVISEGVETESQLECLRRLHCNEIQGYIYGRPLSVRVATEFIGQH